MSIEKRSFSNPAGTTVGWVGTGIMGMPMCSHLMDAGYKAVVFNRTKQKAEPLLKKGATWADSPKAVAEQSDIVFTIVGFPDDVRQVYLADDGILQGAAEGTVAVDMTTTEPSLAKEIYDAATEKGVAFLDAPVSGGDIGARNATLAIMVGGEPEAFEAVLPLFKLMGKNIVHQGVAGAGQHTKMCNQITLSGIMTGVCEALIYGHAAGLDLTTMVSAISKGAAACWVLDNLAPKMIVHDFEPGFYVEHYYKDLGIALKEAQRSGITLPGLERSIQLYEKVQELGHGRSAYHALLLALEDVSKVRIDR